MFARILGGVGRTMIAAGVLLLLFVAFQLWGTGYQTDQAQDRRKADFQAQKNEALQGQQVTSTTAPPTTLPGGQVEDPTGGAAPGTTQPRRTTTSSTAPPVTRPGDTTPPTTRGPGDDNDANLGEKVDLRYAKGQTIGSIRIPKIGTDFAMIEGVDLPLLTEGPGHFPGTAFPGQAGNAAFAGHRVTYKAPFNRIDELVPGDKVEVDTKQGTFTYEVMAQPANNNLGYFIISPTDTSILEDKHDNRITLMACHPKYDLAQRIVVTAKLIGTAADGSIKGAYDTPTLPAPDGGSDTTGTGTVDTLGSGNPNARMPAILLSLAALAVWLLAYLVGRKWKKWPAYFIAAPVFFVLLWFAFGYINQALPSAY